MNKAAVIDGLFGLQRPPVAGKFQESDPESMARIDESEVRGRRRYVSHDCRS